MVLESCLLSGFRLVRPFPLGIDGIEEVLITWASASQEIQLTIRLSIIIAIIIVAIIFLVDADIANVAANAATMD